MQLVKESKVFMWPENVSPCSTGPIQVCYTWP